MELSLRRIGEQNLYYKESDVDSDLTLVFVPGGFNTDIWKNQDRYFSKKYRTVFFKPTVSQEGFQGECECLKSILDQKDIGECVLISGLTGNMVVQELEDHRNVAASFMTGRFSRDSLPPKLVYKFFWSLNLKEPKLFRKTLFSDSTHYKTLKEFSEDVETPKYEILKSFIDQNKLKRPEKYSTTVYSDEDILSSLKDIRSIHEDRFISLIERAGVFSFYEKPQEYNKALNDFLDKLDEKLENKKYIKVRENNRSLFEFEKEKKKKPELKVKK